jgi:hypothetical protein
MLEHVVLSMPVSLWLILLTLSGALIAGLAVIVRFADRWLIVRRINRIPQSPRLEPTRAEHIPAELAALLQSVVPQLERLGFAPAASVHAPDMAPLVTWTQVLFIHRQRGDRASLMWLRRALPERKHIRQPELAFATELPDGRSVKTGTRAPLADDALDDLYRHHRAEVKSQLGSDVRGVVPDAGTETAWLAERAAAIAAEIARASHFGPARRGYFRPSFRSNLKVVWQAVWAKREPKPGFEVLGHPDASIAADAREDRASHR